MEEKTTVVDFVARGEKAGEWLMVLVEEGPWQPPFEAQLRRLQNRLYGCIDVAIDGALAGKFPDSLGSNVIVRLDCYNVPREAVSDFFEKFIAGVFATGDYKAALEGSNYVKGLSFQLNFEAIH